MESLGTNNAFTPGEQKINEYVNRIRDGESKDSIFQDLPESFKSGIEKMLVESQTEKIEQEMIEIPPQYRGLNSEALDLIWTFPEYIDQRRNNELNKKKIKALAFLREKESVEKIKNEGHQADQKKIEELRVEIGIVPVDGVQIKDQKEGHVLEVEEMPPLSIEERKKLRGWAASYELAKIAKQKNIDLSKISREEYANFAIQNFLNIDDDQLRVVPWQRMGTSVEEIVLVNRERRSQIKEESEKAFAKFSYEIRQKAGQENRFLSENIRVRQGTKDSNSWLFFGINNGTAEKSTETYKSYLSIKDLNILTPEKFTQFMVALRDAKYNGDIKIFQDLSEQGVRLNDQIVMHGGSEADAELALRVAKQFFSADIDQMSIGKDEVIDGKNRSYSQILARKIAEAINP